MTCANLCIIHFLKKSVRQILYQEGNVPNSLKYTRCMFRFMNDYFILIIFRKRYGMEVDTEGIKDNLVARLVGIVNELGMFTIFGVEV